MPLYTDPKYYGGKFPVPDEDDEVFDPPKPARDVMEVWLFDTDRPTPEGTLRRRAEAELAKLFGGAVVIYTDYHVPAFDGICDQLDYYLRWQAPFIRPRDVVSDPDEYDDADVERATWSLQSLIVRLVVEEWLATGQLRRAVGRSPESSHWELSQLTIDEVRRRKTARPPDPRKRRADRRGGVGRR